MVNNFLTSKIVNVFGAQPKRLSEVTLSKLLSRNVNAFIAICWKPGDFKQYFETNSTLKECKLHDFLEGNLLSLWDEVIHDKEVDSHIILLPNLKRDEINPLFSQARSDLYQKETYKDKKIIFLANYQSYEIMTIEDNKASMLGKELIPEIWLFESLPQKNKYHWLTGGECQAEKYFFRHINQQAENLSEEIRRVTHNFVAEMMQKTSFEALDKRLRSLLNTDNDNIINKFFAEMYALLPGTFDPKDKFSRQSWFDSRFNSRWRIYSLLRSEKQALLMGGLIRYEPGEKQTQFRLRNPMLAYVVARHGINADRWACHAPNVRETLNKPHVETVEEDMPPTSLDYYIDVLLDKALNKKDGQDDHWTVAKMNASELSITSDYVQGQWWKRLLI